jgi:hypothetical protein
MTDCSTSTSIVYELHLDATFVDRQVRGESSGRLAPLAFLRAVVGLLARGVRFKLKRRR